MTTPLSPAASRPQSPHHRPEVPSKDAIAALPPFQRLELDRITLVNSTRSAQHAYEALIASRAWGFDTESKPTFRVGDVSDGPHVLQLATNDHARVFQLHDADCRAVAADLLAQEHIVKAGFGLRDDRKRVVQKFGVDPANVLELNNVFRAQGYRQEIGVKGAVAVLFQQNFPKSKKAATSNWLNERLSESQLIYAANDAYAAYRVWEALNL